MEEGSPSASSSCAAASVWAVTKETPLTAREITATLLIEIPKRFPARVWRRNVGAALAGDRFIRFSVPGEADITGIIKPGIRLEIEVKAGKDRPTDAQNGFLAMVSLHGGIALIARDVETTLSEITRKLGSIRR